MLFCFCCVSDKSIGGLDVVEDRGYDLLFLVFEACLFFLEHLGELLRREAAPFREALLFLPRPPRPP